MMHRDVVCRREWNGQIQANPACVVTLPSFECTAVHPAEKRGK